MDHASSFRDVDAEDWVLVPADSEADSEPNVPVTKKPLLEFHFSLKLNTTCATHNTHRPERSLSAQVPRVKLERSLHVAGQEQSRLFALPLEVRLQIYHSLLRPLCTNSFGVCLTRSSTHSRPPTVLSVLLTCRRALCEAEHIFYSSNRLWIDDVGFLRSLGPGRRSAISALAVPAQPVSAVLETLKNLQVLPHLRSLHLVRRVSVKYTDVSSWNVLASQLVAEIDKLTSLEDFKIITPEAPTLTHSEVERKKKLDKIDDRLRQAVQYEAV